MDATQFPFLIPYFIVIAISIGLTWYAWSHRRVVGAISFSIYSFAQILSTVGYVLELTAPTLQRKLFWDDFQWLGVTLAVYGAGLFGLRFTNRMPQWNRRTIIGLAVTPTLFLVAVLTNSWHGLVRGGGHIIPGEPFGSLLYDFGIATWIFIAYIYLISLWVIGLLVRNTTKVKGIYRWQSLAATIGFFIPMVAALLAVFDIEIFSQRDISPIAYTVGNVVVAWGLFRYGLFDVVPVARERVLESMSEAVIVLDTLNRVVEINPSAQTIFGTTANAVLGKDAGVLFAPWPELIAEFAEVNEVRTIVNASVNEQNSHFELNILPLHGTGQTLTGRLIVLKDITELVEARQQAEKARDEALEASRIKSQFLASMSHELRTPLNAILSFNKLLAKGVFGDVNDEQVEYLEKSVESGKHLLSLINDVLDMTKIQSDMMKLFVEEDFDVASEVSDIAVAAEKLLGDKPVRLVTDIDSEFPPVVCDKRRVKQVLLNLISNAVKFTEEGTITISAKHRGDEVLFAVMDTGPGIPLDQQEIIFEPFVQTETGIKHAGGTGLGLPISRRLVEAHGGRLWVESQLGQGTAFYVTLPMKVGLIAIEEM